MPTPRVDLSGDWRGHYEQEGRRFGISMHVEQRGAAFAGEMRDEHTLISGSFDLGATDGSPELAGLRVEALTSMPERSVIEGELVDDRVLFVKRYLGEQKMLCQLENQEFEIGFADHRVTYEGRLVEGGTAIAGRWRFPSFDSEEGDESGVFELRRVS
jgi:hypothetical protein